MEQSGQLGDKDSAQTVNVGEALHTYDRVTKLPRALVEEISRTTTLAQHAWVDARKRSNFAEFRPWLEKMIGLKHAQNFCYTLSLRICVMHTLDRKGRRGDAIV